METFALGRVISAEDRDGFIEEMPSSKADWQLHIFGGVGHSFTNPRADEYGLAGFNCDASADRQSWRTMLSLLNEVFV